MFSSNFRSASASGVAKAIFKQFYLSHLDLCSFLNNNNNNNKRYNNKKKINISMRQHRCVRGARLAEALLVLFSCFSEACEE